MLAFVQAGITTITTLFVLMSAAERTGPAETVALSLGLTQLVGAGLLIFGGIWLLQGTIPWAVRLGNIVELALSVVWIAIASLAVETDLDPEDPMGAKAAITLFAFMLAVMPIISLIQTWVPSTTTWLRFRRGGY